MTTPPTVETIGFEPFQALGPAWNDLVRATPLPTPFLASEWITTWWRHFGGDAEFRALVVRDGAALRAGVPLALRRVRLAGCPVTVAEIAGTAPVPTRGMGLADRADLAIRVGEPPEVGAALATALADLRADADVLDLKGVDDASPTADLLRAALPGASALRVLPRSASPWIELPDTFDAYLKSRSRNFREQLKKHRRRLASAGAVEIARFDAPHDLDAWLDEVEAVDRASWKAGRGTNLLRHPALRAFVRDVAAAFAAADALDLTVLRVDGRPITYDLCFDFAGTVGSYNHGYDAAYARLSPGTVVTAAVIEAAIARGRRAYDLLRGDEDYKARWGETLRREVELVVPGRRLRGRAHAAVAIALKARLKRSRRLADVADRLAGLRTRREHAANRDEPPVT